MQEVAVLPRILKLVIIVSLVMSLMYYIVELLDVCLYSCY